MHLYTMYIMYIIYICFTYLLQTAAIFRAKKLRPYFSSVPALKFSTMTSLDFSSRFTISCNEMLGKCWENMGQTTWNEILDVKSWVKRRSAWVSKLIKMLSFSETLIFQDEIARSSRSKIMAFIQASLLALRLGIVQRHRAFVPVLRGKVGRHRRLTMEVTELGRGLSQHLESSQNPSGFHMFSTRYPYVIHM